MAPWIKRYGSLMMAGGLPRRVMFPHSPWGPQRPAWQAPHFASGGSDGRADGNDGGRQQRSATRHSGGARRPVRLTTACPHLLSGWPRVRVPAPVGHVWANILDNQAARDISAAQSRGERGRLDALENRRGSDVTVGSNPTASAQVIDIAGQRGRPVIRGTPSVRILSHPDSRVSHL